MLLETLFTTDFAERILHRHRVCAHHASRVDMDDIDMVKRMYKVGARDNLPRFMQWDLRQSELVRIAYVSFAEDKCASEDDCCSLSWVSNGSDVVRLVCTYTELLLLFNIIVHGAS
jgi:hypothetical protein